MAYTHADGRIIHAASRRFRVLSSVAVKAGDLVYMAGSTGLALATQTTAASALTTAADFVACEDIAAAGTGWCALAVELKAPDTIGAGGAVTAGTLATTADIGAPLYLAASAGCATSTAPSAASAVIKQYVGYVLSTDRVILSPLVVGKDTTA